MTRLSRSTLFQSKIDRLLDFTTRASAITAATIVIMVLAFLANESIPALRNVELSRFVFDESWHPLSAPVGQYNLIPMVVASLSITIGSIFVAGPLGIASALFTQCYAPPTIAVWYRRLIELLAGIPSVVFGLWGLVVLVPIVAGLGGSGQSLLTATMVLALMILPTVALTSQAALGAVPREWTQGAAALGLGRWAIARRISIPAARKGIATGLMLAIARAIGETMAVLMLAGNVVQMPDSLLAPVRTLTANIALEMGYAADAHRSILFVSGLVLMGVVTGVVLMSGLIRGSDDV